MWFWTNTVSLGCNLVGKGLFSGSPFSQAILRFVAAVSNMFSMASKERIFILFPKYLILDPSNVFQGKTGSLPNIRKNGDSFECSLGIKLYTAQARGIKTSHSNCDATRLAIQDLKKHGILLSCHWKLGGKVEYKACTSIQVPWLFVQTFYFLNYICY